jgi:hypothetical protein
LAPAGLFTVSPAKECCQLSNEVIAVISAFNVLLANSHFVVVPVLLLVAALACRFLVVVPG